tara:strand:+ start:8555 stop:9523 length:969 start_codon:yes stop_codon:yes gene_type:complete
LKDNLKKVVVIGGGSGSSVALKGLKKYEIDITAIVTMFDSGGSTGILRDEFGYPSFGDLRQCLLALASDKNDKISALKKVLDFRFDSDSSLRGHSVGNLIMAALTTENGNIQAAIDKISDILLVEGQVIPVTLDDANLCAKLLNGEVIYSESSIDLRDSNLPGIDELFLDKNVSANPSAIQSIKNADVILLGPGDLYTSIIPNLLLDEINVAIKNSSAPIIFACNLMTKYGETYEYSASKFSSEIVRYLNGRMIDYFLVNSMEFPSLILDSYDLEKAKPVLFDEEKIIKYCNNIIYDNFAFIEGKKVRHDSGKLSEFVISKL